MPAGKDRSSRAKIARRVIEVLDYFDDAHREAGVMDIARRYNRPQSSTSNLLATLVELGLLCKDSRSRHYSLTPRTALLGWSSQPAIVRDGRLVKITDRLLAQTGLPVAIFAMTGVNIQIASWRTRSQSDAVNLDGLHGGAQFPLSTNAAGWLLLSTVPQPRRDGIMRRLNAEASDECKFNVAEMSCRLQACIENGWVEGPAGCNTDAKLVARLLPIDKEYSPLAVGFVYEDAKQADTARLLTCLDDAICLLLGDLQPPAGNIDMLASAA